MDEINPATKQYIIFSAIISLILSFIWNFVLIEITKDSFTYGFPINLSDASGITLLFYRFIDTLIVALFLIVPVFYGIKWIQDKQGWY